RDPFQSMAKLLKLSQSRAELPPLQRLELSDAKLIGIVSDASGYYGLIQTPDGKGYTVRVGTLMGTNNGTIKSIAEQRNVVAEPTPAELGSGPPPMAMPEMSPPPMDAPVPPATDPSLMALEPDSLAKGVTAKTLKEIDVEPQASGINLILKGDGQFTYEISR